MQNLFSKQSLSDNSPAPYKSRCCIRKGATSDTNLRMLVDTITTYETEDGLKISVKFNGDFPYHKDYYDENGQLVEKLQES